jgi:glycerol-3-phosphate O-acyltransferase
VYQLATHVVPPALSALLHGLALRSRGAFDIEDRVSIDGEVVALQSLVRRGTVILAPNHTSNLDSLVLGSAIHRLDLPPVAYGAGLNLFSNAIVGFFMRHLGGYTVDRKKTDPVYRDTLKTYATVLLERGQHGLFFPGGTRSRSGALESKLKMGLLGTAPIAYRHALESGRPRPRVFVVPCTVTYPLVLEAATLVEEYLRKEGGPRYVDVHDEFDRPRRRLDFLRGLRALDARVHLRISRPLDWLGNPVDDDGTSRDPRGRPVDPARYLLVDGVLAEDAARDAEYTRLLAAALLAAYRRGNTALPTSVVAFVVFEHLRRLRAHSDLFRFLRSIDADTGVPVADVVSDLGRALQQLEQLEREGALHRGDALRTDPRVVLSQALAMFSTYHPVAVLERRGERLHVGDASLLFYYRNRLEGYGLLGTPNLLPGGMVTGRGWGS